VPHGVTVSCESYTRRFAVCLGSPSDAFAASSGLVHLRTLRFMGKEKNSAVVAKATARMQGSVKWFRFVVRIDCSVGQCVI
jgi:hypothetical protein